MLLNSRNDLLAIETVYIGTINSAGIRAAAILVAHNHSSQSLEPSPEDVLVTRHLIDSGALLDVPLLDHLIVCRDSWLSMRAAAGRLAGIVPGLSPHPTRSAPGPCPSHDSAGGPEKIRVACGDPGSLAGWCPASAVQ